MPPCVTLRFQELNRTKLGGIDECVKKMEEVRQKQANVDQVLMVARMKAAEERSKYYDGMKKGPTKEEFMDNVNTMIARIDAKEVPEVRPEFKTADQILDEQYEEEGAEGDDGRRRTEGLGCCQLCIMHGCYLFCLQCPGFKIVYQDWRYRSGVYVGLAFTLIAYKATATSGFLLLISAALLLFARWRGEAEPILDDPWAKISELQDNNDLEEEDEEEEETTNIPAKKKGRRMK